MDSMTEIYKEASILFKQGYPLIFPTDTVYGLGLAVHYADSLDALYALKKRDTGKPIAWLVGQIDSLGKYGKHVSSAAALLAEKYWPGPLTLIVEASDIVPKCFQSENESIALRMPANEQLISLIRAVGSPLATTSANMSGALSVKCADQLTESLTQKVKLVIRDDASLSGKASTIIDCTSAKPRVLREGAITKADIEKTIKHIDDRSPEDILSNENI